MPATLVSSGGRKKEEKVICISLQEIKKVPPIRVARRSGPLLPNKTIRDNSGPYSIRLVLP
jgi:hypothetical protein